MGGLMPDVMRPLAENVALFSSIAVAYALLGPWTARLDATVQGLLMGLVFGAAAILCMASPILVAPGVFIDGRLVLLGLTGPFGGPLAAGIAALMAGAYRISLGGSGALPGLVAIVAAALSGVAVAAWVRHRRERFGHRHLAVVGLLCSAQLLPTLLLLPADVAWPVIQAITVPFSLIIPVAMIGFGALLLQERRRREAEAALRDSERRFRGVVELANDAILSLDQDGRIILFNEGAERIFGYTAADVLGQPLELLLPKRFHDSHPRRLAGFTGEAAASRAMVDRDHVAGLRKDGTEFLVQVSISKLATENGLVFTAIARDVTDQKRAEQELRNAKRMAEEASQAKSAFVATMSHEIRTPLNAIIGFADLLADDALVPAERKRYLGLQREAGQTLAAVVDDILDFSRLEAGRLDLDPSPCDLRDVAMSAHGMLARAAEAKGLDFRVSLDDRLPHRAQVDGMRLRQVLLNLLNNAIKFTARGTITLTLTSDGALPDGRHAVRIAVTDTGIGIPADRQGALFRPFTQLDRSMARRFGGSGLGLAICRKLIGMMGGDIGVMSEEGVGSTFWATLTLDESPPATAPRTEPPATVVPFRRTGRILVAEDVMMNQVLVERMLTAAGHRVDIVEDGVGAVAAVQKKGYDLVLMDVQMPNMDGLEATRRIRALPGAERAIPIVAMTAHALAEQVEECRTAGMDRHVAKPIERDALLRVVEGCLGCPVRMPEGAPLRQPPCRPAPPLPVFDPGVLDSMTEDLGADGVRRCLGLFLDGIRERLDVVHDAYGQGDWKTVEQDAHAVVSLAGNAGCKALSAAARDLVTACQVEREDVERRDAKEQLLRFLEGADDALAAVERHLKAGGNVR